MINPVARFLYSNYNKLFVVFDIRDTAKVRKIFIEKKINSYIVAIKPNNSTSIPKQLIEFGLKKISSSVR